MASISVLNVDAAAEKIQIGPAFNTKSYIAGVTFPYKITTDGKYLYCLNTFKKTVVCPDDFLIKMDIRPFFVFVFSGGCHMKEFIRAASARYSALTPAYRSIVQRMMLVRWYSRLHDALCISVKKNIEAP